VWGREEVKVDLKPTVEYRQHECYIDAESVGKWVYFVEGVVRKAEEIAAREEAVDGAVNGGFAAVGQARKYTDMEKFPMTDVRAFCAWIGLSEVEGRYWVERRERFEREKVG
jgi:Putative amidoligase enzyme